VNQLVHLTAKVDAIHIQVDVIHAKRVIMDPYVKTVVGDVLMDVIHSVSAEPHHTTHHHTTLALLLNTDLTAIDTAHQDVILGSVETVIVTQVNVTVVTQVNTEIIARNHAETVKALALNTLEVVQYVNQDSSVINVNILAQHHVKEDAIKQLENAINVVEDYMETFANFNALPHAQMVSVIDKQVNVNSALVRNTEANVKRTV
jgi:hypothetical protein